MDQSMGSCSGTAVLLGYVAGRRLGLNQLVQTSSMGQQFTGPRHNIIYALLQGTLRAVN